jgi:predicted TIM-barrel fold metal-dependent hydrolase
MPYVQGQTVHDADSHVMELPGTIESYLSAADQTRFLERARKRVADLSWAERARQLQADPEFRAGDEANLLLRKNYQALGSFRKEDRSRALDLLGFTSQLVFTTDALGNYGLEDGSDPTFAVELARAHNRMMVDYCRVDRRLLPTAYVPLVDRSVVLDVACEAVEMGCKGLMIPSRHPGYAHSHVELEPLWALAQEAGLPILLQV